MHCEETLNGFATRATKLACLALMNYASVQEVYEGSGKMNEFQTPHRPSNCVEPTPFAAWGKTPVRHSLQVTETLNTRARVKGILELHM